MILISSVQMVGDLVLAVTCGYAFWRGGRPERWAAAIVSADWLATPFLEADDRYHHLQVAIFSIDAVTGVLLTALALTSKRYWPLWMAAFQILELLMHAAMVIDHHVRAKAYFVGMEIASYLMLIALAAGVWLEAPRGRPASRWRTLGAR